MVDELFPSISNLASKIRSMIQGSYGESNIAREMEKLRSMMRRIRTELADADEREITALSEKLWLRELREVAYDADDILSDFNYSWDSMKMEHQNHANSRKRKLEVTGSIFSPRYDTSFLSKIQRVTERYREVCQARDTFCLSEEDGIRKFQSCGRLPSSSFLDPSEIFGREIETKAVIDTLINFDLNFHYWVVALVGMAGIGKTTVAKLVFSDTVIQKKFQLKGWVWVCPLDDEITISKKIIESFTYQECALCQLSALRFRLEEVLAEKKFFLVLNNVQDVNSGRWKVLQWVRACGVRGSCIMITTENDTVAKCMGADVSIPLRGLSWMDSWALFSHYTFNGRNSTTIPERIMEIAQKLVAKCSGVPVVLRALGSLSLAFCTKEAWEDILQSNVWDLEECRKEMHILSLSYHGLPAHLKPCFRSCAMFPQGHLFEADSLVRIWNAQGLIQAEDSNQIEVGHTYVNDFIRRSFFQCSVVHRERMMQSKFTMHDLSIWLVGGETAIFKSEEIDNNNCKGFRYKPLLAQNIDIALTSFSALLKEQWYFQNLTIVVE